MKKYFEKIKRYIKNPSWFFMALLSRMYFIPDKLCLKLMYRLRTKMNLNLKSPKYFNEKIQWLKLYDRKPEYTKMVDKYMVREVIAKKIGEQYLIPLYGVWDSFDEIPFDTLPEQFVLKCTHDCGSIIICKDKKNIDMEITRKHFDKCIRRNYYYWQREWLYKNLKPRIIAEKLMIDESGTELKDYKIQCFNGEPKIIQVDFNRFSDIHKRNFYSLDWEYQPFSLLYPTYPEIEIKKPQTLTEMLDIAGELSRNIPYVRVDLYSIEQRIYFGELTFHHGSGYEEFTPPEWNEIWGSWLKL